MFCRSGGKIKNGESRLFYDITEDHAHVAVVGLGPKPGEVPPNQLVMEDIDVARQHIRSAAAVGAKVLRGANVKEIQFDDFEDPEGQYRYSYRFQESKKKGYGTILLTNWCNIIGNSLYCLNL